VTGDHLKIELACFGPKISHQEIQSFENLIRIHIKDQPLERKIRVINSQDLQEEPDVVMVPGEVYPDDGIRLVTFGDFSKELCCGTHVFNTKELMDFTFLSMRTTGRNSYLFTATTGYDAIKALSLGDKYARELKNLSETVTAKNFKDVLSKVRDISIRLNNSDVPVAFLKKLECQAITADIKEKVKYESRGILSELLDMEMKSVLQEDAQNLFIVHFLSCSDLMKAVSLQKATRYVKDRPVLIVSLTNNLVKARCCVPEHLTNDKFNAEKWLQEFANTFESEVSPPKGQDPLEVCNMKEKRINPEKFNKSLQDASLAANQFAKKFLM
jgi:alanyl-tRNA synthetase